MYKIPKHRKTSIQRNTSKEGEMLETKIERLLANKEPIKDAKTPLIYTERKEGIRASTNIRTDRFEVALDATDKIARSYQARREERANKDGKPEPIQGKEETSTTETKKPAN